MNAEKIFKSASTQRRPGNSGSRAAQQNKESLFSFLLAFLSLMELEAGWRRWRRWRRLSSATGHMGVELLIECVQVVTAVCHKHTEDITPA